MTTFDPDAPLPGAPDPWVGSEMPARRDGPPYAMTEMIAAEPALAERLVGRLQEDPALVRLAEVLREAAAKRRPMITTGCGTSEHAAMVTAELLTEALDGATVWPMQALEVVRRPPTGGVLLAVSHEGGTWATNEALKAARAAESTTALITVSDRSPGAALADLVLTTGEQDQSWCHTVGYLSPIVTAFTLDGELRGLARDAAFARAGWAREFLFFGDDESAAEFTASALASCSRLLIVGSGLDYPAARELALKVEEGARMPASALQLETIRHGHLAAADHQTGLVLVLADTEALGEILLERSRAVLRSAAALGMPAAAFLADHRGIAFPEALTPAGRMNVLAGPGIPRAYVPLATAIPLQLLAERMARARGQNPDSIGRDDPRQAAAADA